MSDPVGGQHEVVVVYPHDGWRVSILLFLVLQEMESMNCFLRELFVDLDVRLPVVSDESSSVGHGVEQWPEGSVAAPIVVAIEELWLSMNRYNLKAK